MNYCCGILEVGDFDTNYDNNGVFISRNPKKMLLALREELNCTGDNYTAAIATTIPSQRVAIAALRACKFQPLKTFKSASTGSRITLWFKKLR